MRPETLSHWIDHALAGHGRRKAVTFVRRARVETVMSYAQLGREIAAFAALLQARGVGRGDRVILFMGKSLDAVIAHLATLKIGAVSVPLNPGFKAAEMAYLLGDAQARLVICDTGRSEWIRAIDADADVMERPTHQKYTFQATRGQKIVAERSPESHPEDPALIIYTSGTTGNPKGAVLTQKNLNHDAGTIIAAWEISSADTLCHALPLFHIHGLCFALHTALLSGAHTILLEAFDADVVLDMLARPSGTDACTTFMAVPAMYTRIMDRLEARFQAGKPDFSHLRLMASGSAPLSRREFARIASLFGQPPVEREGMSETGMNFSNPLHGRRIPGSIGLPLPGLQVRIVDPRALVDVETGQVGEIWLKSESITPGYWRKPGETRETFQDGWFRTGDLGRQDSDGYYYLTDRIKHIIITGGENVSAKEVESVINGVEGVVESAVVGLADDTWGERVVAAVVARPGVSLSTAQIQAVCKAQLHDWKCPKAIKFVETLPRNTMGKVLKEEVKKIFGV